MAWSLWKGLGIEADRFLAGLEEEEEEEEVSSGDSPAILAQSFLWFLQSVFWQSREQYHWVLHFAQRLVSASFLQTVHVSGILVVVVKGQWVVGMR